MSMIKPVVIVGASTGIGRAIARAFAGQGTPVLLAGRDHEELEANAADLRIAFDVQAEAITLDACRFDQHERFIESCLYHAEQSTLGGVVLCHGYMTDQSQAMNDFAQAQRMIEVNYTSAVSLMNRIAGHLRAQGDGFICGVSSVAGDRGRQSNFIYGSTKAGLTAYLQGLRNAMHGSGVDVITIKPGMVHTAMTWGSVKGGLLVAEPERVAGDIVRAVRTRRSVAYSPWFWRWIMLVIRCVPEPVFKRMKL